MDTRTANMQEHLIVLRSEIAQAELELNFAKKEFSIVREQMDDYVVGIHKEVDTSSQELKKIKAVYEAHKQEMKDREDELSERETSLDSQRERFEVIKKETENKISLIVQASKEEVSELEDRFVVLSESFDILDTELKNGRKELAELNTSINIAKDDLMVHREFVRGAKIEISSSHAEIGILLEQKAQIQKDVEDESTRIKELYAAIEEREIAQDKRESNYKILKGRLGKVLATIYPEQNIDNLI